MAVIGIANFSVGTYPHGLLLWQAFENCLSLVQMKIMESITIHPQSKEQIKVFEQMAKALKIPFEKTEQPIKDNLAGEEFKQTVIDGQKAYKKGDMNEFVKLNREDLWK